MSPSRNRNRDGGGLPAQSAAEFEHGVLGLMPALRRYSRALTGSASDGEDLLQDCLERAIARRGQWQGANLKGWVFSIMTNLSRNRHRARARDAAEPIEPMADTLPAQGEPDAHELMRLSRALDTLSADHRAVLMLVAVEGYAYQEVAGMLDIPLGTVMSRLSRARRQLADVMDDDNVISMRRHR